MKTRIETFEKAIEERCKDLKAAGINGTLFWAYRRSEEAGNNHINFNDVIWDNEIEEIADCLKANGITEFTISSNFSGLITTLAEFEKHGFTMNGITDVNEEYIDFFTNERKTTKAIKMIRK